MDFNYLILGLLYSLVIVMSLAIILYFTIGYVAEGKKSRIILALIWYFIANTAVNLGAMLFYWSMFFRGEVYMLPFGKTRALFILLTLIAVFVTNYSAKKK